MAQRAKARRQVALPFDGRADLMTKEIRGGKGQSLAVMQQLGLRVPPAFTVSTTVMRAFSATGVLPKRLAGQLAREMATLERKTGKKFGGRDNPLLVSVRSGASISMEGMMDTILNLGMTHEVRAGFEERGDAMFGTALYECMYAGWKDIIMGDIPNDPWAQLTDAIVAVIRSWDNPRAQIYREHHGISHTLGTAVNVQAMVYGNRDERSGTGVVFSHNVNMGDAGMTGEFRPCAQGDVLVGGKVTPHGIEFLKDWNQSVYEELERGVKLLAAHEGAMVEVEFTVESGVLSFLQYRKAKASLEARITYLVHDVWAKRMKHDEALASVSVDEINTITDVARFDLEAFNQALKENTVIRGIGASHGVMVGMPVFTSEEAVERSKKGERVILVRPDTDPDDLPGMLAASGIITQNGGATCHAAVTARALGKPAIVGAANIDGISPTDVVSMDGGAGVAVCGSSGIPTCEATLKKEVSIFKRWARETKFPKPTYMARLADSHMYVDSILKHVYLLELMAHEAKGSVIALAVNRLKCKWYTKAGSLFLCYLVHAVARELRHIYDPEVYRGDETSKERVNASGIYYGRITDSNRNSLVLTDIDAMDVLIAAAAAFGQRWADAYGGERWRVIAQTAIDFLSGSLGYEVFVDRVFDLQHNTGSVFGKHGMLTGTLELYKLLGEKKRARKARELMVLWDQNWSLERLDSELVTLYSRGSELNIWR